MRLLIALTLMVILATPVLAEPVEFTGLPLPTPSIAEYTIIQGTGWSTGSTSNESLACDIAHQRALKQLKKGIAVAKSKHLVTTDELIVAIVKPPQRVWNATQGRCVVHLELTVPALPPTRPMMMVHERQY